MRFVLTRDPAELAARAEGFLAARLERNVLATVLVDAVDGRYQGAGELYLYGLDDSGEVAYAALRTPPWLMLSSELRPGLAAELVRLWLAEDPDVPGVNGVPATARAIASAWSELTGGSTRLRTSDAMHALETVIDPPRPASGTLRVGGVADRDLLIAWMAAFGHEAGTSGDLSTRAAAAVDRRMASGGLLVWEDGEPVCVVGVAPRIAGTVRIGPVYTPPERRRHGYASSAVAAASRRALAGGAERCMLFTDLANPTSNKIYADVGYRRFGDWEEHAFEWA